MADRYHVVIIDTSEFDWNKYPLMRDDKDPYDLYNIWETGGDMPDGTWVEEWLVSDDSEPSEINQFHNHWLLKHECHIMNWNEIGRPEGIKEKSWWDETIKTLEMMLGLMSTVYPLVDTLLSKVIEILDEDQDTLTEAMQGHTKWTDADTLAHWIWLAKEYLKKDRR